MPWLSFVTFKLPCSLIMPRGNDLQYTVAKATWCCGHTTHYDLLWTAADWLGDLSIGYALFDYTLFNT